MLENFGKSRQQPTMVERAEFSMPVCITKNDIYAANNSFEADPEVYKGSVSTVIRGKI